MKKLMIFVAVMTTLFAADAFSATISDVMPVLRKAKQDITSTLTEIDKDLKTAAKSLSKIDPKGDDARTILQGLSKYRPYVIDCAIIDAEGKMITVEPAEYKKYEGSDISGQQHVVTLEKTKMPVMSSTFHSVENSNAVDIGYPILTENGDLLGAVSMLIKVDELLGPLVKDTPCKVWVMQPNGLLVYDPDPDQVGRNIFTDEMYKSFEDLISFSKTVAYAKNGAGSYDFYIDGLVNKTLAQKVAVWDTVGLYGAEWRVVVMEIEKTLDKPAEVAK